MLNLSRNQAYCLILIASVIWGSTFVAQQIVMQHMGAFMYSGMRFLLGSACLLPLLYFEIKKSRNTSNENINLIPSKNNILIKYFPSVLMGCLLFSGVVTQQIGIKYTSVANAGFLTALYVPIVPIFAWLIYKKPIAGIVWFCSSISAIGIIFIADGSLSNLNIGDLWVLFSVIFWATHVLFIGAVVIKLKAPICAAFTQFITCGTLALICGLIFESTSQAAIIQSLPYIIWGGVLSVGIGFTCQVIAQQFIQPSVAAVIFSAEFLFAAICGYFYLGEHLSILKIIGGTLIMTSIILVQIRSK